MPLCCLRPRWVRGTRLPTPPSNKTHRVCPSSAVLRAGCARAAPTASALGPGDGGREIPAGEGALWLGAKEGAEAGGDLPETCARGSSPMGVPRGAELGASSQQQIPRERNGGAQQLRGAPTPAARRQLCPLAFAGWSQEGSCSPFPKSTRGWREGSRDPGRRGCGRAGDRAGG